MKSLQLPVDLTEIRASRKQCHETAECDFYREWRWKTESWQWSTI